MWGALGRCRGLGVAGGISGIGFWGVWGGLGSRGGAFPRAVARGVFGTGSGFRVGRRAAGGGGWFSVFRDFSASAGEAFILVGSLGTGLSFYGVQTFSWYFLISKATRKTIVYTTSTSNNCPSFHLWWKGNVVKHKKVLKYYENNCLQIFFVLFMSLLTGRFVKNIHI